MLGDQGNLVINAKMVDRRSGNRTVGGMAARARARSSSPALVSLDAVSTIRLRIVPSGPVRVTTTLISSVCPLQPHFGRQTPTMAAVGTPGRLDALLTAEGVTVHACTPSREHPKTSPIAAAKASPMMTKRHEQPSPTDT